MIDIAVALFVWFLAVLLNALFAGYETGFVACNPIRMRYLSEEEKRPAATRLLRYLEAPDRMLTALLIGTNIGLVISTIVVTQTLERYLPRAQAGVVQTVVSALVVTPVQLVFSEIIPKSVFRTHPNRLTLALLPVITFFYWVLYPVTVPAAWASRLVLRSAGDKGRSISPIMSSIEELRVLVDEGASHGSIEKEEQEMIHSVIDLQTTRAKEIMVPRIDIQALPETATREELVRLFAESGRSRIPVYKETVDEITGIIHVNDVLGDENAENEGIGKYVREAIHVPDTIKVDDLFQLMKTEKQHMAVVTDEYGGTDGIVTIEDILEEIFGEIQDEHDREELPIHQVGPHAYVVDARTPLAEFSEAIGVAVEDEDVETVGGWLMHLGGAIPSQGEMVSHGPFQFTVLEGTVNQISKIRVKVDPEAAKNSGADDE